MALRLYVWGPAFGLPSLDPDCLATIAYLSRAVPTASWELRASSPSAVPTRALPTLHDSASNRWVTGFHAILAHLRALSPAHDLDADLTAPQSADAAALSAFLATHAAPLVALSLYVSSANWLATTRPAYSHVLPFPLTWTEPPAVRAAMASRAEHLGLSSLDADAEASATASDRKNDAADLQETADRAGFHIPTSLRMSRSTVAGSLTPEQKARIRLEEVARDCLSVLAEMKGQKKSLVRDGDTDLVPTGVDCLAFGYLALMVIPDVPRPWLREVLQTKYAGLSSLMSDMRALCLQDDTLPWASDPSSTSILGIAGRFFQGSLGHLPVIGGDWQQYTTHSSSNTVSSPKDQVSTRRADLLFGLSTALAGAALVAGIVVYRRLPPFGAPIHRFDPVRRGLRAFGTAGSMLGLSVDFENQSSWTNGSGSRGFTGSEGANGGFEAVSVEVSKSGTHVSAGPLDEVD